MNPSLTIAALAERASRGTLRPGEAPVVERYGHEPFGDPDDCESFTSASASVGPGRFRGSGAADSRWDLTWSGEQRPMWTLPRRVWERELLPSAHVVLAPKAAMHGSITVAGRHLEVVSAVARRPGMRGLPSLGFIQLRRGGKDWPGDPLLTAPLFRTRLSSPTWRVRGILGSKRLTVTVNQPDDRCVRLDKWRGRWITEAEWSLEGTAHAELGTR